MTIPDLYGQITAQDIPDADPALLRVLNRLQSTVQNVAVGGMSLSENSKCDIISGVFSHGVATQVKLSKVKTPGAVQVLGSDGHFPLSASVASGGSGGATVTLFFASPLAVNVKATIMVTPEGTRTSSAPDPNPIRSGFAATGYASASALSITAGGNTWVTMSGLSGNIVNYSTTRTMVMVVTFSGYAGGAAGVLQMRGTIGSATSTGVNFYYNTMGQHQSWTFQLAFAPGGTPVGTSSSFLVQVISPTGSLASFTQDANDSGSIVIQELG